MPKSLDKGPSKIVPVMMSDKEKAEALAVCKEKETLSAFIREAVRTEVAKRVSENNQKIRE